MNIKLTSVLLSCCRCLYYVTLMTRHQQGEATVNQLIRVSLWTQPSRRHFWRATHDCVVPYVDIIPHRRRFWAKSAASGSVRWWCFRSCWTVLSHVMRGRPSCLLQSAGGDANRILLASALSSMHIICPNKVSRHDWIIAVSLGCFVSLRTSSFIIIINTVHN